jgi:hypothetical protein
MTYDELVTNIRNYTQVGPEEFTAPVLDTFITFAENRILREIDLDVFKKEMTGNVTAGNRFLTAPTDMLTHRYMLIKNYTTQVQVFLEFRDTSFMKEYWKDQSLTGVPKYFSVWDQNTFYLAPTPDLIYIVELGFIYRPTQLSSTNTTTWISTNAPEALFYACMIQAYSYLKGPTDMQAYFENSYKQAISGLGVEQQGRRRRDEYRDGMMRIPLKSDSPGP